MGAEIKRGFYWHRVQGGDSRTQYILLNWTTEAVDVGLLFLRMEIKTSRVSLSESLDSESIKVRRTAPNLIEMG